MKKLFVVISMTLICLITQAQCLTSCNVNGQLSANVGDTIIMPVEVGTWTMDMPYDSIVLTINTCNATLISDEVISFANYTLEKKVTFIAANAGSLQWKYFPDKNCPEYCGSSCTVTIDIAPENNQLINVDGAKFLINKNKKVKGKFILIKK